MPREANMNIPLIKSPSPLSRRAKAVDSTSIVQENINSASALSSRLTSIFCFPSEHKNPQILIFLMNKKRTVLLQWNWMFILTLLLYASQGHRVLEIKHTNANLVKNSADLALKDYKVCNGANKNTSGK